MSNIKTLNTLNLDDLYPALVSSSAQVVSLINGQTITPASINASGPITGSNLRLTNSQIHAPGGIQLLNGGAAQGIRVGNLLVSDNYGDTSLVPTNGAYIKGATRIGGLLEVSGSRLHALGSITGSGVLSPDVIASTRIQSNGYSTSYGVTGSVSTIGFNVIMGTGPSATWMFTGTSNGEFRGGYQVLDAGGVGRLYLGSNFLNFQTGSGTWINLSNIGTLSVNSNATIQGNVTINGNTTLGDATSDTVTLTGRINSNVQFTTDNTNDIGASGANRPRDLFLGRNAVVGGSITGSGVLSSGDITSTSEDIWVRNSSAVQVRYNLQNSNRRILYYLNSAGTTYGLYDSTAQMVVWEYVDGVDRLDLTRNVKVYGSTTLGDSTANSITFAGRVNSNIQFSTDNTNDIGASGANRPRDLFLGRNITAGGAIVAESTTAAIEVLLSSSSGSISSRRNVNSVEHHIRPNSGRNGWISFTEDSVADRWLIGIVNGDSNLYFRTGTPTSNTTRVTVASNGNVTAADFILSSDIRLKENLVPISNALDKVNTLTGYQYNFKNSETKRLGVIAQEVQKVAPEAVTEGSNGYLGVSYDTLVPLLIESIKELTARIEQLEKR